MSLKPHRVAGPALLRVRVDRERCQGHARCVAIASELFRLDAFGNAHEIGDGTVPPDLETRPGWLQLIARNWLSQSSRNKVTDMRTRPPVADWASDFDHLDPAWVDDPYPIWDELRQKCPIAHTDRFMGVYFVSRFEDVRTVAHDSEHFSSRRVVVREGRPPVMPAPPLTSDPPVHSAQKRLLLPAFTPDAIRRYEPQTRAICRELLEPIATRSGGDGATEYAQEIPVRVIAAMLGIPPQSGDLFRRWIHEFLVLGVTAQNVTERALAEIRAFFAAEIAKRREAPRDDLISYLADARIDGQTLDDEHITGTLRLLLIAGIDTTWSMIGSCLWHLATHADDRKRLVAEPALIPTAVEELLRAYAPVTPRVRSSRRQKSTAAISKRAKWCSCRFRRPTVTRPCFRTPAAS
jgi:cytochrome P450